VSDGGLKDEIEDYLIHEAHLLDSGQAEEWLALFSDDGIYWLPGDPDDASLDKVAIVYDDRTALEDRVWRLSSPLAHSQRPRSRTIHVLGNVRIVSSDTDSVVVQSNVIVTEARLGDHNVYSARCEHRLRRHGNTWRIKQKKVQLLTSDFPIRNLTFLI
jgi:3-phenylpropionate/cinnamic acid dioxygenase small subunit